MLEPAPTKKPPNSGSGLMAATDWPDYTALHTTQHQILNTIGGLGTTSLTSGWWVSMLVGVGRGQLL